MQDEQVVDKFAKYGMFVTFTVQSKCFFFHFWRIFSSQHIPQQFQHKHISTHIPVLVHTQKCVCAAGIQCNSDLGLWNVLTILRHQSALWSHRLAPK